MNAIYYLFRRFSIRSMVFSFIIVTAASCNKLVEVDAPPIYTTVDRAYGSDGNAISVLNDLYADMSRRDLAGGESLNTFVTYYTGLSADDFSLYSSVTDNRLLTYYRNNLNNTEGPVLWTKQYERLYRINDAIEGLTVTKSLTPVVQRQLLGEAKFLRAFSYFYLVNLYGRVPLVLTTQYKVNAVLARSSVDSVYQQIVLDLRAADSLLGQDFVGKDGFSTSSERIVPNRWAARAVLARTYLYLGRYQQAAELSSEVIMHSGLFDLPALKDVFKKNSREAIWQLQPVNVGWNTEVARVFIIPETGPSDLYPVSLSDDLLSSFEPNDQRKLEWIDTAHAGGVDYFYPYKYKSATENAPVTEYEMVLRLGEQYLIRAEALARLGKIDDAIADLDAIRHRAGLAGYAEDHETGAVVAAVMRERRVELFTEWGHRWLDLKRTGMVDSVMGAATPKKGGTWASFSQLYPVPLTELRADPFLEQNRGY